ncbi:helix-turn-helix domain-containing protein [Corynebacterium riegelii]|uniref:helix-turn-helix domain-containing protein n=1 Tax=Corynebacterium riegelii TaxID=156976 RepID=UPI0015E0609C|nr:helix-turn-helix domain-containing protein [Corynebacterium riegelii]
MSKTATANNTLQRYETLKQAAERTGLAERTLRRRIEDGSLIAYRLGRAIRLRPEDVDALFTPTNAWAGGEK